MKKTARLLVPALVGLMLMAATHPDIEITEIKRTATASVHRVRVWTQEAPHYHARHDSEVTLVKGGGTLYLNGVAHPLKVGDKIRIPRKVPHHFVHQSPEPYSEAIVTFKPPFDGKDRVLVEEPRSEVLHFKPATERGQILSPGEKPPPTTLEKSK